LAEPPEGLNTSDIEKEVAEVPLVNGNHIEGEKSEPSSPDVIEFVYLIYNSVYYTFLYIYIIYSNIF